MGCGLIPYDHARLFKIVVIEHDVCSRRRCAELLIELKSWSVPGCIELAGGFEAAQGGGVALDASSLTMLLRGLNENHQVPGIDELWPLKKRPIDDENGINGGGLGLLLEWAIIRQVERGGAISAISVRTERIEEQSPHSREIARIMVISVGGMPAAGIAFSLRPMKSVYRRSDDRPSRLFDQQGKLI